MSLHCFPCVCAIQAFFLCGCGLYCYRVVVHDLNVYRNSNSSLCVLVCSLDPGRTVLQERDALAAADPHWIPSLVRGQQLAGSFGVHKCSGYSKLCFSTHVPGQMVVHPEGSSNFTSEGHDLCGMKDMAELLTSSNDDMLNRPAMGLRTQAATIRAAYGAIESHLQKPTCLFNAVLFSRRLAPLSEAMHFLSDGTRTGHAMHTASMKH